MKSDPNNYFELDKEEWDIKAHDIAAKEIMAIVRDAVRWEAIKRRTTLEGEVNLTLYAEQFFGEKIRSIKERMQEYIEKTVAGICLTEKEKKTTNAMGRGKI